MTAATMRPDVRRFLDALAANPRPALTAETLPALRPLAAQGMAMLEPPVGDLAEVRDVAAPGPAGDIALRLFDVHAARPPGPAVVFCHGGGFVIGGIDTHVSLCAELSRQLDLPVISVEYRLAPEHPWPAAPDDAEAAARWIAAHPDAFGREFTGLVLCGDSAGATLTIVTALALRNRPAALPVRLQIAFYPAVDIRGRYPSGAEFASGYGLDAVDTAFYTRAYAPHADHWRAVPLNADAADLPPAIVVTAQFDPLRDQGRAYAAKLVGSGVSTSYVEAPGTIHGFLGFRRAIPSGQHDLDAVLAIASTMLST